MAMLAIRLFLTSISLTMLKLLFYLAIILCFVCCTDKKSHVATATTVKKPPFIVVINKTGSKNLLFKYFDYHNNSQLTPFPSNDTLVVKTECPIVTYDTQGRSFNDLTYYTIYPSDTIRLEAQGNAGIFTAANAPLRKKLNLMSKLYFNVGSLNYSRKESFAKGRKAIEDFYQTKKRIIDSNKSGLDIAAIHQITQIVEFDKLASLLLLHTQFSIHNDSLLTGLNMADSTAWDYLTFRNVINDYNLYINKFYHVTGAVAHVDYLRTKLPKAIQDYAVFHYLSGYRPAGKERLDTLNRLVNDFDKQSLNRGLAENLNAGIKKYNGNFQTKDSKEVALLSVLNADKPTSLSEVIKENQGKLIYIDFWATWCIPCLGEMPSSSTLVNQYKVSKSAITFLYLSQDENMDAWQNKSKDLKLSPAESFVILKNKSFGQFLAKYNLRTIPRYMIIGKKGEMLETDALRPSDPKLKTQLDNLLK